MSEIVNMAGTSLLADAPAEAEEEPRGWAARVMLDTVGRTGVRLGLAWIAVVGFCAVFAPLLASSFPILAVADGRLVSPWLAHLTPADVTLLVTAFAACIVLPLRRFSRAGRWLVAGIILGLSLVLSLCFVHPPKISVYEQYREELRAGHIKVLLGTPLPFSANDRLRDQFDPARPTPWKPSIAHPFGTEQNGADILSRMIHASRIALTIGLISTGISLVIGTFIGGMMGYFAGVVDLLGMRLVEIFGSIPQLYLLLAFVAFFPRNLYVIMVIIGITSWVGYARFVRADFLKLRKLDFVQAAVAEGLPLRSILFRHLLPNALAPLLVTASFGIASAILLEATLSFLGLGPVDEPSWGQLLNEAVSSSGEFYWWLATFPGLAIFLTVFAYNLIGEALRDALDPRS